MNWRDYLPEEGITAREAILRVLEEARLKPLSRRMIKFKVREIGNENNKDWRETHIDRRITELENEGLIEKIRSGRGARFMLTEHIKRMPVMKKKYRTLDTLAEEEGHDS